MKKVYQKPEFEVITQNQANAKFFVASFSPTGGQPQGETPTQGQEAATSYNRGSDYANSTTDENGGFTF